MRGNQHTLGRSEDAPHPDRERDPTSRRERGEVNRSYAQSDSTETHRAIKAS
jgi:hypothetical protein